MNNNDRRISFNGEATGYYSIYESFVLKYEQKLLGRLAAYEYSLIIPRDFLYSRIDDSIYDTPNGPDRTHRTHRTIDDVTIKLKLEKAHIMVPSKVKYDIAENRPVRGYHYETYDPSAGCSCNTKWLVSLSPMVTDEEMNWFTAYKYDVTLPHMIVPEVDTRICSSELDIKKKMRSIYHWPSTPTIAQELCTKVEHQAHGWTTTNKMITECFSNGTICRLPNSLVNALKKHATTENLYYLNKYGNARVHRQRVVDLAGTRANLKYPCICDKKVFGCDLYKRLIANARACLLARNYMRKLYCYYMLKNGKHNLCWDVLNGILKYVYLADLTMVEAVIKIDTKYQDPIAYADTAELLIAFEPNKRNSAKIPGAATHDLAIRAEIIYGNV